MSSEGSYGALQVGGSTFTVPGVTLSGGAVTVQMNTVDEEKSGDFNLGSGVQTLTFGAGPYLRSYYTAVDLWSWSLLCHSRIVNYVLVHELQDWRPQAWRSLLAEAAPILGGLHMCQGYYMKPESV